MEKKNHTLVKYTLVKDIYNKFFKDYTGIKKAFYHPINEDIILIEDNEWAELINTFIDDAGDEKNIEVLYFEDEDENNDEYNFNDNRFWKYDEDYYKTPDGISTAFKEDNFEELECVELEPGTEQAYLNNYKEGEKGE